MLTKLETQLIEAMTSFWLSKGLTIAQPWNIEALLIPLAQYCRGTWLE
jgi:hypothetical protein